MTTPELNDKLTNACASAKPDLDEIKELVLAGADPNCLNEYGDSIFCDAFVEVLYGNGDNPKAISTAAEKIKAVVRLLVAEGWDVKKSGLSVMRLFTIFPYGRITFDLFRFMLQYDLADDSAAYENALEAIGGEESFQRCCMHDHDAENMFYAVYEMVEAKMKGLDYRSIVPYYDAIGMTIDKIVYFSETNTLSKKADFTEYNADIGLVCGDQVLVLCKGVNILFMNGRIAESPQIDISAEFGKDAICRKIKRISFDHRDVITGRTHYGQPTIVIELANGKKLKFTHNFGEVPDRKTQSRFWIE